MKLAVPINIMLGIAFNSSFICRSCNIKFYNYQFNLSIVFKLQD